MFRSLTATLAAIVCFVPQVFGQTSAKVDFARDVQPILRQNCYGCHGPKVQNNGLRLDRRSSVLKPGARRVVPGSSDNSYAYLRLIKSEYGIQMPPTGTLKPELVAIIRSWIDQGAEWPDALANEMDLPPLDQKAIALVETLRAADLQAFRATVAKDPRLLNARGPEGSTPFMYAVLYTDTAALEKLIKQGADPNKRNDAGATALMWAAVDLEKTKVLLAHGADVNVRSGDARTALMVAASRPGGAPVVKLLLAHGANPNPNSNPSVESSPLLEAALAGDAETMKALLDHGADIKEVAGFAMAWAAGADCAKCVDMLIARKPDVKQYTIALQMVAVLNQPELFRRMIEGGADVNAVDPTGRTALMYAAISDLSPVEQVRMLIEKGAAVNARSQHSKSGDTGLTALDLAELHGDTPVVDLLKQSGGTISSKPAPMKSVAYRNNTVREAVTRSIALLQRADASFMPKAGCFSCHNQSITAVAVALARKSGLPVDEKLASQQVMANAGALAGARDLLHEGTLVPAINANPAILAYALIGLDAEGYKPDLGTDAVAMFIQSHQMADGRWAFGPEARPPLCADELGQTVLAMRGLQLYAPRVQREAYTKSVQSAANWISGYRPKTFYDLAWRLLGLSWGRMSQDVVSNARRDLLAVQRADGGWPDLVSMESGAFTTGLAMMALQASGLPVSDPAYQRGVQFLLNTQLEDGSWHVRSRAAGFQPYFDNGYPHGVDQWISAAGSGFATVALALAASPEGTSGTQTLAKRIGF